MEAGGLSVSGGDAYSACQVKPAAIMINNVKGNKQAVIYAFQLVPLATTADWLETNDELFMQPDAFKTGSLQEKLLCH